MEHVFVIEVYDGDKDCKIMPKEKTKFLEWLHNLRSKKRLPKYASYDNHTLCLY